MDNKKLKNTKMISPERYSQALSKTELIEIYLESCSVIIKRESLSFGKNLEVSIKDKATFVHHKERIKVTHKYYLNVKQPETGKEHIIKISAAFCLIYSSEDSSFDDEFFKVFKDISLPLHSWPYFREFAQSTTHRMNIPPITLPLIRR